MGNTPEQLRKGLEEMAKKHGPAVSNIAKVKSVDEEAATCVLIDEDGQEIFEVRLRPVLNGNKSILMLPKIGSYVLAVRVEDDDDWMIVGYDEITKIGAYLNDVSIEVKEKISLTVKEEDLETLLNDLFTAIENMVFATPSGPTTALNNIADFMQLKQRFNKMFE